MPLTHYELYAPRSLEEALDLLSAEPDAWRPFAGGTDLMVLLEAGTLPRGRYLSLWHLSELRGIELSETHIVLGALTTYTDILRHPTLALEFPMLEEAARQTGAVATQNRGTIGGNIANASPAADTPPALLVYDAELELLSARGRRTVPYDRFHTGYKTMDLQPGELIGRIRVPRNKRGWHQSYRKVGTRRAQAIAKVCFAAAAQVDKGIVRDVRVALGSVAPAVVRCRATEAALHRAALDPAVVDRAVSRLADDIAPIDDMRSTARYRSRVAQNLLRDFLGTLAVS
jgi:CO/xanthine dehydrogenase FAD-binding subunit